MITDMDYCKFKGISLGAALTSILVSVLLLSPVASMSQNRAGTLKAPANPTPMENRERTIQDLLYFPFTCINAPIPASWELARKVVENTFGLCEKVNNVAGLHTNGSFDFTYRGARIGLCFHDGFDNRTWYQFYFEKKSEADAFYNGMVKDIQNAGIPLTKDKVYGGMSNRKRPVSIFKWVYVSTPVKVKEPGSTNIEPEDCVGMYNVELGVYKRKVK